MEILTTIVEPVVNYISVSIGRQLGYLFFYKRNIKDLEKQLENLRHIRERVQSLVKEQRSNSYEIYDNVLAWLKEVDVELHEMPQQNEGSCFNCVQWHRLARKTSKRVVEQIPKLIEDGEKFNKDNVGNPAPLPDTKCPTLPADYQILKTRTLLAEQIKDALADPNVNKVGVCGMGGVGKTKLLDEVKKLVLQNNLFHRVVVVLVGESNGAIEIQDKIIGMLNIKLDENSKEVRASHLRNKIVEMKVNILIMLDDLWKEYDLEREFGIPCRSESRKEGCKILMTSRDRDLLTNKMNTDKLFEVDSLNEEESWKFFMAIVGEFVGDIEPTAKDVVKKCGGLPIALKTLARSLKGRERWAWENVLKKLKNPVPVDIRGVSDQLYSCLKISYDSINDEAKLLFLLCSIFPDDYDISVKDLQMYSMGMGLLNDDKKNWKDVGVGVMELIDDLKSSYLLLESNKGDGYVQMHDVVRNVAKYIASKIDNKMSSLTYEHGQSDEWREEDKRGSYNAIFVNCKNLPYLPSKLEFPNLRLLILRNYLQYWKINKAIQIPDSFFEGMENLRVLDLTSICFESSLTQSLKNLQTLCMSCLYLYNSIDTIGQLKKLKILRIDECSIEELPESMSQLTELKMLEVLDCYGLKVIHPNIISSMTKLEELSLWGSFKRWGEEVSYKNKLIKNVKLCELNGLTRLFNLKLQIQDVDILSNQLSLKRADKLEEFFIWVGDRSKRVSDYGRYTRGLKLDIKSKIDSIGGTLQLLLQRCEYLYVQALEGSIIKTILKPNANYCYPHLKHLEFEEFPESLFLSIHMPRRIENITPLFDVQVSFPHLKDLKIWRGDILEMLWHNNRLIATSFCKLQNIDIRRCNKLTYLFPSHMVTSLVFLNTLRVEYCELLERIFEIEELMDDANKVVPLTTLELINLSNLKYVWNNDPSELLTYPNLKKVVVRGCPQLKSLFPASFIKHMKEIESLQTNVENEIFAEDEASKLVFPEIVLFPSLRELEIHCKVAKKGSFWVRRSESFPKLQTLHLWGSKDDGIVTLPLELSEIILYRIEEFKIYRACQLVQVFRDQNKHNQSQVKLKTLDLDDLPNLMRVWEEKIQIPTSCFDSLERIKIYLCKNLKCILSSSSITLFNLTSLKVDSCHGMMNLFNSSVAKSLVNLSRMEIYYCQDMTCVVTAEEGEGKEENNGEEIIFNRMRYLSLIRLPWLTSFYSSKCTLEFPCLEDLTIRGCPGMKIFSYGIISTPKLRFMSTTNDHVPVSPTHGVNAILQRLNMILYSDMVNQRV